METKSQVTLTLIIAVLTSTSCGQQYDSEPLNIRPRIIAGVEIQNRCQSPWNHMVALETQTPLNRLTFCSAVMLSNQIVVTSASCVKQYPVSSVTAIVGEKDIAMFSEDEEERMGIDSVKVHPGYNGTTMDNNIGLIKLSQPATLSPCVKPASRWEMDPTACNDIDRSCVMAGWGPYAETDKPTNSRLPRSASLTVYGDLVTSLLSRNKNGIDQPIGSLYAEGTNSANKACFFDWGGIVSCRRNGNNVLRGIVGHHNCYSGADTPFTVTDLPFFQSWIDQCMDNWDTCSTQ